MRNETINFELLKELLDAKFEQYNQLDFIETDPIQIPHRFSTPENIEISAFLTSTIAWGKRAQIIRNAEKLMQLLDNNPYDFILNFSENDLRHLSGFVHRTFNYIDLIYFFRSLQNIYRYHGGLRKLFVSNYLESNSIKKTLIRFRKVFFEIEYPVRTLKHISDVELGSAAKRLNLMLMWLVRKDKHGVHFGLWNEISASDLFIPLDVHVGNVARKFQLLCRKPNDWKAVEELTNNLRKFDSNDPVKYDFALFGMGVFE